MHDHRHQESSGSINNGTTTVVVAPRILLAEQLCSEFMEIIDPHNSDPYLHVLHVHSGETHFTSTTKADRINVFANCARNMGENVIIFTTYNSLHRVMEADIEVNTIYFDEAHNSVKRNFSLRLSSSLMRQIVAISSLPLVRLRSLSTNQA